MPGSRLDPTAALVWLFATVGVAATGYIATRTVAVLVAEDLLGSATWSGLPGALAILGTAAGAPAFSSLMGRRGRAAGLLVGYGVAAAGAGLAVVATHLGSFAGFAAGLFVCGVGYAANHLARYAAADLRADRQAAGIGWIVWAGTIGAVLGPSLLAPGRRLAEWASLEPLSGPPLLGALALLGAGALSTRLAGAPFTRPAGGARAAGAGPAAGEPEPHADRARFAILSLVVNQLVMVLVMAMTPIHIRRAGEPLSSVGVVLGAHMLGMFAFAPVAGWLAERAGRLRVTLAGHAVAGGAALGAAFTPGSAVAPLALALFGLGLGWSFGFVAGSALLAESAVGATRMRTQGRGDALIATSAAAASLGSGVLLAAGGYATLSLLGVGLAAVPPALALAARRRLAAAGRSRAAGRPGTA